MIKISITGPKPGDLLRAATAAIEKDLASKAKAAALRHGGVTVRFKRTASGGPASIELQRLRCRDGRRTGSTAALN